MRVAPESWQFEAVTALHKCLKVLNPKEERLPDKIDGRRCSACLRICGMEPADMARMWLVVLRKLTPPLKRSLHLMAATLPIC